MEEKAGLFEKKVERGKKIVASLELEVQQLEGKVNNEVAPSGLSPSNLKQARGGMVIHDHDSGVGRNMLFYIIVVCMQGWEKGGELVTLGDIKQALLGPLHRTALGSTQPSGMSDIDACAQQSEDTKMDQERSDELNSSNNEPGAQQTKKIPEIDQERWDKLSSSIKQASELAIKHNEKEIIYSGRLSWILDEFTRECKLPYLFTHQFPCNDAGDTVDIATFRLGEYVAVGLAEVRLEKIQNTDWQLCGNVSAVFRDQPIFVSVGLVIDLYSISLYGFYWPKKADGSEKRLLEHALLWKQTFTDLVDSGGLILKMYFACLYLLSDTTWEFSKLATSPFCPLVGTDFRLEEIGPKVFAGTNNNEKFLFKLFDYGKARLGDRQPNEEYLRAVYEDPKKVDVLKADPDCGVCVLQAPWFEGNRQPDHLQHIILLCEKLQKLHDAGMKHGDVLRQNIVFGKNDTGPFTELIDFDYSHLNKYPAGWNTEFPERHPESREGSHVQKIHDVYAAIAILCLHFKFKDEEKVLPNEFVYPVDGGPADKPFAKNSHPILKPEWFGAKPKKLAGWIETNKEDIAPIS